MPSIYQPRRPRASPLWQLVHHGWDDFLTQHESRHRKNLDPLHSQTVIYRSKRHHTTKRNFEVFNAPDFIAAALLRLPPKSQRRVRYYGIYSNRSRGSALHTTRSKPAPPAARSTKGETTGATQILLIPPPPKQRLVQPAQESIQSRSRWP